MKWLKRIFWGFAALLAVAVALPFLITLDDYIPQLQQAIAGQIKEPVTIKSLRFAVLPTPHLNVGGLTLGANQDIQIAKLRITPDWYSLGQPTKVIRRIDLESLTLTQNAALKLAGWAKSNGPSSAPPPIRLDSLRIDAATLAMPAPLGPFAVAVDLNTAGEPQDIAVRALDGTLQLQARREQAGYRFDAQAKSWTVPGELALLLDSLAVKGVISAQDAQFTDIDAKLYGGTVRGDATLAWPGGLKLNGRFNVEQVQLQKMTALFAARLSGALNAKATVSATAPTAGQLVDALHLETQFAVANGVIRGVDVQQAAAGLVKPNSSGGETRFDQLSGQLSMERHHLRFSRLKVTSGSLAVDGNVNVSPKKELSGQITAQLVVAGAKVGVPLKLSGTVDSPQLYPTAGTVAGAAIGTSVLGPGYGTAVGAKVGNWAQGVFEKSDGKKSPR